jgi:methenyltetrahydromethanopterin cyclohydrolase
MGSGPARALARREALFDDIPHREEAERAVLVLEGQRPPDNAVAREVAAACAVSQDRLVLLHAPTGSPAGTVQIAARTVECALQRAWHLGLDLGLVRVASGLAPVAPPGSDPDLEMGRANDAIRFGGRVRLALDATPGEARTWAEALHARAAPGWERPFRDLYERAGRDFGKMDPSVFSPAEVVVSLPTGVTFRGGRTNPEPLRRALST